MIALDTSKAAIARRKRLREFALQDRALSLSEAGMANRDLGRELGMETKQAVNLAACASQRRDRLASAIPHPDPASFELTAPETLLLKSLLEVHFEQWEERQTCSPDTGWVGRRVRKSKQWAVSCARRRICEDTHPRDETKPNLVRCTGNGYILLTDRGWTVTAALFPELFDS